MYIVHIKENDRNLLRRGEGNCRGGLGTDSVRDFLGIEAPFLGLLHAISGPGRSSDGDHGVGAAAADSTHY